MRLRLFIIVLLTFALPCYAGNFAGVGDYVFTGAIGEDVRAHGATGDGATDDHVAFENAIAAASGGTVHVPKAAVSYKLEDNVTVPAGVTVKFQQGALLSIDVTKTFAIAGTIDAGLWQIFSGAGTASFGIGSCLEVYPEWWGAVGDTVTDCTAAFNSAMIAAQTIGRMRISSGIYTIASPLRNFPTDVFAYANSGYIIEGCGTETVINYEGVSGYAFEIDSNDPADRFMPVGVTIRDLHVRAAYIPDADSGGAFLVVGSFVNIERITTRYVDDATGVHVRSRIIPVTESSMTNDTNRDFTTTGAGTSEKYAIKFTSSTRAQSLKDAVVRLGITGTPAGTVHGEIWTDVAGSPGAQVTGGDSDNVTINTISNAADGEDVTLDFGDIGSRPIISNATDYWLVISTTGYTYVDGVTELRLRVEAGGGAANTFATYDFGGVSWSTSNDGANYTANCRYGQALGVNITSWGLQSVNRIGRGFWVEDSCFLNITNSYASAVEGIKSEHGYLETHNVYLYTSGRPVYATGWTRMFGGVIEGSSSTPSYFGGKGHVHNLIGIANGIAPVTWESGTWLNQERCDKEWWWSAYADVMPDKWQRRIIPAQSDSKRWDTYSAALVSDADALNGYATQFDGANDYIQVIFGAPKIYDFLPRGTYRVTMWAKDANQVANDFVVVKDFYDGSWNTNLINTFTLSADYRPYYVFMRIEESQVGNIAYQHRIWMRKSTGTANTINVSHVVIEYVGPDIVGTQDMTAVSTQPSDADQARRSSVEFWGHKANKRQGVLGQITGQHTGTGNDYAGEIDFKINTGAATNTTVYSILKLANNIEVLPDGDAHPIISDHNVFITNNSSPTTYTDFHGAFTISKMIVIIIGDDNSTFDFSASDLKGNCGIDWTPITDDYLIATYESPDWHCVVSPQQSFGDGTNYFNVASDGSNTYHGTARVTNHVRVAAPSWTIGVTAPTAGYVGIVPVLAFDNSNDDEAHYSLICPLKMETGTAIDVLIDWVYTGGADVGTVCWKLDYINLEPGEAVAGGATTITKTTAGTHTTGLMYRETLTTGITGSVSHDVIGLKLWRDVSEDTLATDANLIQVHFMYTRDKHGESL